MTDKNNGFLIFDRVVHTYLGAGEVTDIVMSGSGVFPRPKPMLYMVKFDTTPDIKYNMAENPTIAFPEDLKAEDKDK